MTAPGMFGVASPEFHHREPPEIRFPGIRLDLANLLQQEQELIVHRGLPASGSAWLQGSVVGIEDRGDAAVLVQRTVLVDVVGNAVVSGISRIHARGEGNGGRGPGPSGMAPVPNRPPDSVTVTPTSPDQAVLYQRCCDGHSLTGNVHTDTDFATAAGLPGPILQGACTYGMVCAAVVDTFLGEDATRVLRYSARFLGVVFAGEVLRTRVWAENKQLVFVTHVPSRVAKPVLSGTVTTD
ncbi:MaoC/PaaZ C-terminal domain-containing protein [Nocardia wallacei]|uniref:MaoC/PaaZ C-terminal domain-containing protein n=1 Tax=Nocardia wallacei TaxID=480035 RepID=UPI0024561F1A|nr:MaoC/PaaZ C-terminal domain-containing protein [Nocardia wallacei]